MRTQVFLYRSMDQKLLMFLALTGAVISVSSALVTGAPATSAPNTCGNGACAPAVECIDIPWKCNADIPTTATPAAPPREEKYCCDYFGTCTSGAQVTGKVSSREITIETHMGNVHKSNWLDMYKGQDHIGSWITVKSNSGEVTTAASPSAIPAYNITDYYMEPQSQCTGTDNTHAYDGWYNIALACVEDMLSVVGLVVDPVEVVEDCGGLDYTYKCNDMKVCEAKTILDDGHHPNSTIPAKVSEIQCHEQTHLLVNDTAASSVLTSDPDDESPADHLKLLYGWIPNYSSDEVLWVKTIFSDATWLVGVAMQGIMQDVERRVDSFTVDCEEKVEGGPITKSVGQGAVFYAGARLDTEISNYFPGDPIRALSLTISIVTPDDPKAVGMRFRPLGCKVCVSNKECNEEGTCMLTTRKCKYTDETGVDPEITQQSLDELDKSGASEEEKGAFLELVGQGDSDDSNTVEIDPAIVTAKVSTAVVSALTSTLEVPENSTDGVNTDENVVVVIEKVTGLIDVMSSDKAAVFTNLTSPEAVANATEVVQQVANIISDLLSPENIGGWELLSTKAVDENDTSSTQPKEGGTHNEEPTEEEKAAEVAQKKQEAIGLATITIMSGVSSMVSNLVSNTAVSAEPIVIKNDNLECKVSKSNPEELLKDGYSFESDNPKLAVTMEIPTSSLELKGKDNEPAKEVIFSAAVVDSSSLLAAAEAAREAREEAGQTSSKEDPGTLVSNLFSFDAIVDGEPAQIPITYCLTHRPPSNTSGGIPERSSCVFHDTAVEGKLAFSQTGMKVSSREPNMTCCKSDHLTTFAVMMYLDDYDELAHHFKIQSKITLAFGTLSVISVAVAIMIFIYLRDLLYSERIIIHVTLMSVTGAGMLVFIVGADRNEHVIVCKLITVLLHFLFTAMFSWMLMEGIHLYRQIITVFESGKSSIWIYFAAGWGLPFIIVAVSTGMQWNDYGKGKVCFLNFEDGTLWAFVGPIIPVILINLVVLCRVIQIVVTASKLDSSKGAVFSVKVGLRSSLMLMPLLGLTWVVGYFQHFHISLGYVFVILNSLQGFFMALFHCFLNTEIRDGLKSNWKKISATGMTDTSQTEPNTTKSRVSTTGTFGKGNKVTPH